MDVNNDIYIDKKYQNHRYYYHFFKRLFDFIIAVVGLVILSPIFLLIAISIKIEDPKGPIFYSQERIGQNQKEFKIYKFRSMVQDADKKLAELLKYNEVNGNMFKMKNDPRVTKVGAFLRKHSLDELPQLWNVVLGNMSLVGPRPPLPREVADYTDYDLQRLIVKPGCTGLWQVSGRNDVDFNEMVELDLEYIQKSSLVFDIVILFKTVLVVLMPNGAY